MLKLVTVVTALMLAMGCHSNPYQGLTGRISPNRPAEKPTTGSYVIEGPTHVEIAEGTKFASKVVGYADGDKADLAFDMPPWVTFDPATDVMTFQPQKGDAFDPKHPDSTVRIYPVTVSFADSGVATVTKTILVAVRHVATNLTVTGFENAARAWEGKTYSATLTITSADFPTGPFLLSGNDLPTGIKITSTADPTKFTLSYTPDFKTVRTDMRPTTCYEPGWGNRMCVELPWTLNVIDPRGNLSSLNAQWEVLDMRQDPRVVIPKAVNGVVPTAEFYVNVEDPNGEVAPEITHLSPPTGSVAINTVSSAGPTPGTNPHTMVQVVWSGNPPSNKGTTKYLDIKSCVQDNVWTTRQCSTSTVSVTFQ